MRKKISSKRMILDKKAKSNSKNLPAFLSPPEGSKAYHGFQLINRINVEGFTYGAITNFLEKDSKDGCTSGDGYVEAPDGSRAGIAWEKGDKFSYSQMMDSDKERWGVYYFSIPFGIKNLDDMKKAFALMMPILKKFYQKNRLK
ncbi:MAG: 3-deoxy-8-phosphooctulonate synthase [Nanoarchaeota archaeon]